MKRLILTMPALLLMLAAVTVLADVRYEPVEITLINPLRPAQVGEEYQDVLRVESFGDHVITDLDLSGQGWKVNPLGFSGHRFVGKGEVLEIPFSAVPGNPDQPLILSWYVDDQYREMVIDRSQAAFEGARPRMSLSFERGQSGELKNQTAPQPKFLESLAGLTASEILAKSSEPTPRTGEKALNLNVTGSIKYHNARENEDVIPQGITVKVIASNWNPFNPYEVIVSGMTDSEGNFDIDLDWPIPENPDIQVFYFAENVATRVYNHDGPPEPWAFSTSIYPLYSETTLDVGLLMPAGLAGNLAMHTAESMRRIREFYDVELGYDFGRLDTRLTTVKDGTSHFNSGQLYIFLYAGAAWSMNIHAHEYGHYVHAMLPMQFPSHGGYCDVNEYCDDDPANGDCGHCLECDEDEAIAFIEGWAEFCAEIANDYMEENYSVPASITRVSVQSIGDCYNRYETFPQNPLINEGFFAAALYDLVDEDYGEEDINNPQGFHDNVGGYLVDVFTCVNTACGTLGAMPQTPADVLQCFLEQHPGDRAGITESYRNNQYYFDTEGPGAPTNLTSNPPVGIPTPDYTIQVTWDEPVDDSSGVNAYGTNWIRNSPLMPGPVAVLGDVTFDDSPTLSPGEWYYCIRARDAAGNWSDSFAWIGPVIISAADPADLAGYSPASWDYPFVPMNAPDGGPTIAHVSTMLNGGTADTYWNMAFRNKGDQYTVTTTADIILDGAQVMDNVPVPSIGGLAEGGRYNQGPLTIPAGRHTLGMFLDSSELMSEDDEFDNYWLGQWAWRPQIYLVAGSVTTHLAPPDPLGGFAYFNDHQAFYTLCSGHRIANHSLYQAVFILPEEREADYDLGIFEKDNSPNLGFRTQLAYSGRPAGKLDVVLANGWNAGMSEEYDIGVYNESFNPEFADGQYSIGRVKDNPIGDNYDKYFGFLDEDRMIDIYTFQFGTESNGYVTFELNPHINKTMNLSYFDEDFTVGRLADATETVTSVAGEPVILHLQAPVGSVCAVAAWMDPVGPISSAHNYDLDFAITKSDPEVYESQNWAASIVPRDKDDRLYPYNPPVPDRLVGNADSTFVYAMERNSSPAVGLGACPAHEVAIHVDGELLDTLTPANALNPGIGTAFTGSGFYNIPGGRHTLTMVLDPTDAVDEIIEYNNEGGNQWVWSPEQLLFGEPLTRDMPADALGGHRELNSDWVFYNCLGFRTDNLDGGARFAVVYAAGGAETADVDLRLFEPKSGTQEGFATPVSGSLMSQGNEEFVIISLDHVPYQQLDVGLVGNSPGGRYCWTQLNSSDEVSRLNKLGEYPQEEFTGMVNVHHLDLDPGVYEITMINQGHQVDLGISAQVVYTYAKRSQANPDAQSWLAPAGHMETIFVNVLESPDMALVVWRVDPYINTSDQTDYIIDIKAVSGVEDDILSTPKVSRLVGAHPNPFNPRTTIKFDVSRREDVSLRVFDLSGRLVRTLVSGSIEAGRHEVVWEGRNDQGREVSSGVYFYRLVTITSQDTKRMTLLK